VDVIPLEGVRFESAGQHLATRVPVTSPTDTVEATWSRLRGSRFESAEAVAVVEGTKLVGLLNIEDLLAASPDAAVGTVMDPHPPVVAPGVDQEVAAWKAVERRESTLAVVDEKDRFLGFVPPERMLAMLLAEHEEDMARLGGFVHDAAAARRASQESIRRRFVHRLPWLLVGLAGAFAAAWMVGAFERVLEANVALAFFVPGIVYMADAVGTQTETLVIRGLSVGIPIGSVLRRELLTGLLVGSTLAALFFPVSLLVWSERGVALAASLALLAASATATLVAMALPLVLLRLGKDPAFGSGPLATVIQDLISILIYFAAAEALV
jgi:magnesium transporter